LSFECLPELADRCSSLVCGFPSERTPVIVFAFVDPGDDGS
jgi:hypothetical protein